MMCSARRPKDFGGWSKGQRAQPRFLFAWFRFAQACSVIGLYSANSEKLERLVTRVADQICIVNGVTGPSKWTKKEEGEFHPGNAGPCNLTVDAYTTQSTGTFPVTR